MQLKISTLQYMIYFHNFIQVHFIIKTFGWREKKSKMSEGDLNLEQFKYWPTIFPLDHCDSVINIHLFLKVNSGQDDKQDFQCTFDKKIKWQNNADPFSFLFWTALTGQREENGFQYTGWNCGLPGHEKRMDRNKCWQENISCKRGQNNYLV